MTHRQAAPQNLSAVALWLLACAGMVFAMAIIGAITRLTESGLSITEWKPITGAIPPLTEAQWLAEFDKYKRIPEYQLLNRGMSLEAFKLIFFWEWFHRLWGRLIGLVFLIPFVFFWVRGQLSPSMKAKGLGLLVLGGLQGFIGWFMVQSGLVDRTDVSHYRLALHLGVAFIIFAALLWVAFQEMNLRRGLFFASAAPSLQRHMTFAIALLAITIIWGAFVAGMDAGFAYNEWPLMNGALAPAEMWTLSPLLLNLVENTAAVQFSHRWIAMATAIVLLHWCWRAYSVALDRLGRRIVLAVTAMAIIQPLLGILTLLSIVWIPLATLHQGGAFILLGVCLLARYGLGAVAVTAVDQR